MLPRMMGTRVMGRSLQRGLVMSISPTQRMPYLSSQALIASRALALRQLDQLVQEALALDVLQKSHHVRMRADHVGDVRAPAPSPT